MNLYARMRHWGALRWTIGILAFIYAVGFVTMLIVRPGSKEFYEGFCNIAEFVPPFFGGICGIVLGVRGNHSKVSKRIGWLFVGLGSLSFAVGQALWTYMETFKHMEVPTPSWADAGYFGSYPFLIVGMILLSTSSQVVGRGRILLDSAIAAAAFGTLSWYFMIHDVWVQSLSDPKIGAIGRIVAIGYPVGDIAVILMALIAFNSLKADRGGRRSMAMLLTGMLLVAISDQFFNYFNLKGTYQTGMWFDWGWPFGWMTLGFACLNRLWAPAEVTYTDDLAKAKTTKGWVLAMRAFAPYIAVALALAITFGHDYLSDHKVIVTSHTEVIFLGALIIVRQIFMLMENIGLTRRIATVNDSLELKVEERTRQITCIQNLTRAVNLTLEVDKVAREGAQHCAGLFEADAVAVWLWNSGADKKGAMPLRHSHGFDGRNELLSSLSSKILFAGDAAVAITECLEDGRPAVALVTRLHWHNEPIGAVAAVRFGSGFEPSEHELIEVVGVELGSAFHNAMQHAAALEAADHDAVTGLFNHRAFHQRFRSTLKKATEGESTLSLMMLDLNNFKLFNDTYGHMAGDHVLKTVAKALQSCLPKNALTARYGGDEFVVALDKTDGEAAEKAVSNLSAKLADLGFTRTGDDRKIPITLSAGISTFPIDAKTHHDLIAVADQNLYAAKALENGIVRTNEQQRQNMALRTEGSFEVLDALVTAVDNKDRYTRKHSEDVTEYALWMAEELGLSQETMRIIRTAGLLHDVGKIGVPNEILRKPDRLTPEEYEIIKRHPRLGELIVSAVPGMEPIIDGVRSHHERWDGQGYPDQTAGEETPFLGRLLAVADAFSAMTTDRPYRKGMDWSIALKQIEDNKGTQFDPELADVFLRAVAKRRDANLLESTVDAA